MIRKSLNWEIIGAVIALDQASKWLAEKLFPESIIKNFGLPFGIMVPASSARLPGGQADGPEFFVLVIVCAALFIFVLTAPIFFSENQIAVALIVGGALANLADRVRLGYVRDVIDVGIGTMNLADVAVWVGIGMLLLRINRDTNLRIHANDTNKY